MEALISKQNEANTNGDQEEAEKSKMLRDEFMQQHLIKWIPQFCQEIERSAKLPLYKGLGKAISTFIQIENEHLTAI